MAIKTAECCEHHGREIAFYRRSGFLFCSTLRLFEISNVLVRFDHMASRIVQADHSIM
jgi:hypothetical protein